VIIKLKLRAYLRPFYELFFIRKAKKNMKNYNPVSEIYGLFNEDRDFDITVSFTTYPARIKSAVYVADAMLRQTLKPDRVILVLAENEFLTKDALPEEYANLEKRGLSIVFTEDLKPHKKYQYAMKNYPDSIIVTVDDDVLYQNNLLERLFTSYKKHPHAVSAIRTHRIKFFNKKLLPYNEWEFESLYTDKPVHDLLAVGVGGVLYPPGCLEKRNGLLFDTRAIKETCLYTDDIWLKVIELLCNVPTVLVEQKPPEILYYPGSQKESLSSTNVDNNRNDKSIQNILCYLGINDEDLYNMSVRGNSDVNKESYSEVNY